MSYKKATYGRNTFNCRKTSKKKCQILQSRLLVLRIFKWSVVLKLILFFSRLRLYGSSCGCWTVSRNLSSPQIQAKANLLSGICCSSLISHQYSKVSGIQACHPKVRFYLLNPLPLPHLTLHPKSTHQCF